MIAGTVNFGWEVMVALVVLFFILGFLGAIALVRQPRAHHLRIGFFIEHGDRDDEEPDESDWPTQH